MLYPQDYDDFELDNRFKGRKPDETLCSLKLCMRNKSHDSSQFIFPPQEVSHLGLDSSHEINDDTECSSLRSASENKFQSSFCSQSSAGSIGKLVRKLETVSMSRVTNNEKARFRGSKDFEENHLALLESSTEIEGLRNSMASSISTIFEGHANRKRLPVWESTPIDLCKSDVHHRNQVPAQADGLKIQGPGISLKGSSNGTTKNVVSNSSDDAPNINLIMQQLQELLATNDNPLFLPLIIHLLNGQNVDASPVNQLQKLTSQMQSLNTQVGANQTQSNSVTMKDARPELLRSSSSESSSSHFCLPNPSMRSQTTNDPKDSKPLHEEINNNINVKRGMVLGNVMETDEFEKRFCSDINVVGNIQNFGKLCYSMKEDMNFDNKEKFRSNQITEIEKQASPPSLAPLSSSSSRATSSLPASMPLMEAPASPLLIPHPSISSKRMSQPTLSSRSTLRSPSTSTKSLNASYYHKIKYFEHQMSDSFKFLMSRRKTKEIDGDDITLTVDEEDQLVGDDINKTNTGQVVHQTLDELRVPYTVRTNNLMKDWNPVPTEEKLKSQASTVKSFGDAYIIPSEVCKNARCEEKIEPTTSSELENPVTPSTDYCNISQSTCEEDDKMTSGIDCKRSKSTRGISVLTRDECIQVGPEDLPRSEEQNSFSPQKTRKSFESPSIPLKKHLNPSGNFERPPNKLFSLDERACGAFTPEELSLECPSTPSSSSGKSSLSMVPKKIDSNGNVIMSAPNQWIITYEGKKFNGNPLNENLQLRKHRESREVRENLNRSKNCAVSSLDKPKVCGSVADRSNFDKKDVTRNNLTKPQKVVQGLKPTQLSSGHKVGTKIPESSKGRTIVKQQNGKIQRKVSMSTT